MWAFFLNKREESIQYDEYFRDVLYTSIHPCLWRHRIEEANVTQIVSMGSLAIGLPVGFGWLEALVRHKGLERSKVKLRVIPVLFLPGPLGLVESLF